MKNKKVDINLKDGILKIGNELLTHKYTFEMFKNSILYNGEDGNTPIYIYVEKNRFDRDFIIELNFKENIINTICLINCEEKIFSEIKFDRKKVLSKNIVYGELVFKFCKLLANFDVNNKISNILICYNPIESSEVLMQRFIVDFDLDINNGIVELCNEIFSSGYTYKKFKESSFYAGQNENNIIHLNFYKNYNNGENFLIELNFKNSIISSICFLNCEKVISSEINCIKKEICGKSLGIKDYKWGKSILNFDENGNVKDFIMCYDKEISIESLINTFLIDIDIDFNNGTVKIRNEELSSKYTFEKFKKSSFYKAQDRNLYVILDGYKRWNGRNYMVSITFVNSILYRIGLICCDIEFSWETEPYRKSFHDYILSQYNIFEKKKFVWGTILSNFDEKSCCSSIDIFY